MATYRQIYLTFWTDRKVEVDFTPEDKYFYLYLLTNNYTNLCGCYEIAPEQISRQTGYNYETVNRLLKRFENEHRVIRYDTNTYEVLLLHWHKYNWSSSPKLLKAVSEQAKYIRSVPFKNHVNSIIEAIQNGEDASAIGYAYPMHTSVYTDCTDNTVVTDNTVNTVVTENTVKKPKPQKNKYGTYENVLLTFDEYDKLRNEYGEQLTLQAIEYFSAYIEEKGYKAKSHYLAMKRWVFDAVNEKNSKAQQKKPKSANPFLDFVKDGVFLDE